MRIIISGGGTGGHIYPALAVARELRDRYSAELLFIGDVNGLETEIVPKSGIPFAGITAGKLRRYLSVRTFTDLGRIPVGMGQALGYVRRFQPHAAFTSGGYVSVPAGIAARMNGAPLVMHQQDVHPNLANRLLTPFAARISVSFPASVSYFPTAKTSLAGNPVREEFLRVAAAAPGALAPAFGLDPALPIVLVTGGSQGARHLNEVVVEALPRLLSQCQVVHVSGKLTYEVTRARAGELLANLPMLQPRYRLYAYLEAEMPAALAASSLVLCRSGAATLAELATVGRPSVLVPLPPGFTGSPQEVNARMFQAADAAQIVLDRELSVARLEETIVALLADRSRLARMAVAVRSFALPDASITLADTVAALARAHGG